jgi:hypothetical protein
LVAPQYGALKSIEIRLIEEEQEEKQRKRLITEDNFSIFS